jgi:Tol biopolymer transport system component
MDIYTVQVTGGEPKRITEHKDNEWNPRWSPDSKWIAFYSTWDNRMTDIHVVSSEGGTPRQISFDPAEDYAPAWSPDGRWIAFFSRRGRTTQIWAAPSTGGAARALTPEDLRVNLFGGGPDWSPDGQTIIFEKVALHDLYVVSLADGHRSQLTKGERDERNPAFSPDGKQILFVSNWFSVERNLTLMSSSGRKARPVLNDNQSGRSPREHRAPAWSRDGRFIAFPQTSGGYLDAYDLWVVSADGRKARQLTQIGFVNNPVWCEGDTIIVFTSRGQSGPDRIFNITGGQIWKVSTGGGAPVPITDTPDTHIPTDYSPILKQIIFHRAVGGANKLFLLPMDGGEPQQLETELKSSEGARWSPDGRQLAFISNDTGEDELYVMPSNGGGAKKVTNDGGRKSWPSWSVDGQRIVFSRSTGRSTINAVAVNLSMLLKKR